MGLLGITGPPLGGMSGGLPPGRLKSPLAGAKNGAVGLPAIGPPDGTSPLTEPYETESEELVEADVLL